MGADSNYCKKAYPVPSNIDKKLAVDIGANIGGFSTAYNEDFEKIIFFEANPKAFEIAKNNTKNFKNVKGYNLAVSDESGKTLKLMNHFSKDLGSVSCSPSITDVNEDWVENIGEIKTTSLEDIFKMIDNQRINYLKLDCENSEYEILMNKDLSNIDYIAMELHWQMGEKKYKELLEYVSKYFNISGNTSFRVDRNTLIYLSKL
jgi:FkbM family methyltransferase